MKQEGNHHRLVLLYLMNPHPKNNEIIVLMCRLTNKQGERLV